MLSMEQSSKILWKDSSSRSKTGLNASMITFHAELTNVIESMLTTGKDMSLISAYENR
jgi:hypothetical protein